MSVRSPYDTESFGKLSEGISRFIGSWWFIAYMTAFVAAWMLWKSLHLRTSVLTSGHSSG